MQQCCCVYEQNACSQAISRRARLGVDRCHDNQSTCRNADDDVAHCDATDRHLQAYEHAHKHKDTETYKQADRVSRQTPADGTTSSPVVDTHSGFYPSP